MSNIAAAITRSISHNGVVRINLDDLLNDDQRKQMNEAAAEWDRQAYMDHRRDVISGLMCDEQGSHIFCDSVLCGDNYDVVDMWGTTDSGNYRVHIRL